MSYEGRQLRRKLKRDVRRTVHRELKRANRKADRTAATDDGQHIAEQPQRARAVRIASSAGWKFRRQLAPLLVIGATYLAGLLAHVAHIQLVLVLLVLVAVAVWLFTRKWLDERRERVYAALILATVLAWILTSALWGVRPPMPAILVGAGCLAAMPWWWRHQIRATPLVSVDTTIEDIWAERVAASGRALPGARLVDVHDVTGGIRGRIRLVAGDKSTDDAIAATKRIASAFEKPVPQVIVEPTMEGIASHAQLTVLSKNPLRTTRYWQRRTFEPSTGMFDLGVYADSEIARFMFVQRHWGAKHALIVGTTGSGKTNTVNTILTEAHLSRQVVIWVIDPQMGQSLPAWNRHVDWCALGVEQAMVMLHVYKRVMMARAAHMSQLEWTDDKGRTRVGKDHYDLVPEMPLHYLVLEEAHELLTHPTYGPEAVSLVEDSGKMGRKTGSGICLINQMGSLAELGGSQTLRAMVSSGNVIVHRTADRVTGGQAFSGAMPVEPHLLPEYFPDSSPTYGLGYIRGIAARHAAFRSYLVDDPYGIATSVPALPLDPISADAAGDAYANRHDPYAIAAAVKALKDGSDVAATPMGSEAEQSASERTTLSREVLHYLTGRGDVERGHIIHATCGSPRGVANALNALIADGLVEKVDRGVYRAVETAEAADQEDHS